MLRQTVESLPSWSRVVGTGPQIQAAAGRGGVSGIEAAEGLLVLHHHFPGPH